MTLRELIDRVPEEKLDYKLTIDIPDKDDMWFSSTNTETLGWVSKIDDSNHTINIGY